MPRVIHFEIHAENPERAIGFYSNLLGWKFRKWDGPMPYWLIETGDPATPGINGGLIQRMGPPSTNGQPVNAYVCTVDVPNVDEFMTKAQTLGAAVALPKMAISGVGWLGYIIDSEGNILGLMHNDPGAK